MPFNARGLGFWGFRVQGSRALRTPQWPRVKEFGIAEFSGSGIRALGVQGFDPMGFLGVFGLFGLTALAALGFEDVP